MILESFFLFLVFLYVINQLMNNGQTNQPPGPRGIPIFGSLLTLTRAPSVSKCLIEMAKEYGPVMSLKLGSRYAIALTGFDIIREALVEKADYFSGRPILQTNLNNKRLKGIVQEQSEWKERRRMALMGMRDFGLGKKSLDARIDEEAGMLVEELTTADGQLYNLHNLMPVVTTNIICSIIRGERFEYRDEIMKSMTSSMNVFMKDPELAKTENYVPWIHYMPWLNINTWKGEKEEHYKRMGSLIQGWINTHKEQFDSENIRDLIDLFISESRKEGGKCKEENILPMLGDLLLAGTETTSTTLLWCITYLIIHNDIQEKCRQEIHEIVGHIKIPDYSSSKDMPYVNAFLNEVQRAAPVVPLAPYHTNSEKIELGGYTIPKDSIMIINLESALKDEKYWGDPYTFRPERWLDDDGQLLKKQALIPFSIGKRECLGELLAKKELFVFLTSMLQNFEFEMEDGTKPPDLVTKEGLVNPAPDYMVRVKRI